MNSKFPLGKISVKVEAAYALSVAGQEASFFIEKHASGDWGEEDHIKNEDGLRHGTMVLSKYHTLRGHEIFVVTFLEEGETYLFCPPNSVIRHVPLYDFAQWYEKEEP